MQTVPPSGFKPCSNPQLWIKRTPDIAFFKLIPRISTSTRNYGGRKGLICKGEITVPSKPAKRKGRVRNFSQRFRHQIHIFPSSFPMLPYLLVVLCGYRAPLVALLYLSDLLALMKTRYIVKYVNNKAWNWRYILSKYLFSNYVFLNIFRFCSG